jgi:multiple sugar transport system permease protein
MVLPEGTGGVNRNVVEQRVLTVGKWMSLAFFVFITAFPLVYMIALSFKDISQILKHPSRFLPGWDELNGFETYRSVLRSESEGGFGFVTFIRNSAIVALSTVIVTVSLGTLAAYAAARLNFFGKRQISAAIVLIYLFPAIVLAIPLFVVFSRIGLRDSLAGLSVVYLAQTIPVALYMLRSYFETVPREIDEAAMADGCTRLQIITKVTIPLSAPAIAAVSLYVFMIAWNEFLFAFLFLQSDRGRWTLPLGLQQLDTAEVAKTVLMAGSVIISVPIIILFFFAERFLTEGLTAGGVKG